MSISLISLQKAALVAHKVARKVAAEGLRGAGSRANFLLQERVGDHLLGVQTRRVVPRERLGLGVDAVDYEPTGYAILRRVFARLSIQPTDVLLDYGSGKGRVLAFACQYHLKRVIGLELSPALVRLSRRNLQRRARKTVWDVRLADASQWSPPNDVSIAFLFNPFTGPTLAFAMQRLHRSLRQATRRLQLVYIRPRSQQNTVAVCLPGLRESERFDSEGLVVHLYYWEPPK